MNGSEPLIDRDDDENSEIIARQDDVELSGICGMTLRRPSTSPFSVHLRGMRTPPRENHAELLELHRNLIFDGTTFQPDGESEQESEPWLASQFEPQPTAISSSPSPLASSASAQSGASPPTPPPTTTYERVRAAVSSTNFNRIKSRHHCRPAPRNCCFECLFVIFLNLTFCFIQNQPMSIFKMKIYIY